MKKTTAAPTTTTGPAIAPNTAPPATTTELPTTTTVPTIGPNNTARPQNTTAAPRGIFEPQEHNRLAPDNTTQAPELAPEIAPELAKG